MHMDNISKTCKEKFRKGAWPRSSDPINFGVLLELDISGYITAARATI